MGNWFSARAQGLAPGAISQGAATATVEGGAMQLAGRADANMHAGAIACGAVQGLVKANVHSGAVRGTATVQRGAISQGAAIVERGAMQVGGRADANVHAGAIAQGAVQSNVDANVQSGAVASGAVQATVHSDAVRGNAEVQTGAFQLLGVAPGAVELQTGAVRGIEEGAFEGMFSMVTNIDVALLPILVSGGALVSITSMVLLMVADPKSLLGQLLLGLLQLPFLLLGLLHDGKLITLLALCGATACLLRIRQTGMTLHAMRRESALKDTMLANKEVEIANKDQTIQRLQIDLATTQGGSVNKDETLRHRQTENVTMKSDLANKEQTLQRLQIENATNLEALQRSLNEFDTVNEAGERARKQLAEAQAQSVDQKAIIEALDEDLIRQLAEAQAQSVDQKAIIEALDEELSHKMKRRRKATS